MSGKYVFVTENEVNSILKLIKDSEVPEIQTFGTRLIEALEEDPQDSYLRQLAKNHSKIDDELEIDDNAIVSHGEGGAFVMAWLWVDGPEEEETDGDSTSEDS